MANVDQNEEPSMEDILASIRKIISDDDDAGGDVKAASVDDLEGVETDGDDSIASTDDIDAMFSDAAADTDPSPEEEDAGEEEVLELTSDMAVDNDVVFAEDDDFATAEEAVAEDDFDMAGMDEDEADDVSFAEDSPAPAAASMAQSSPGEAFMNSAAGAALLSSTAQASVASAFGNLAHTVLSKDARTLEDLVKEMLRPMLKGWLDDNLPQMVERLVREEIERLSRGGMR